MQADAQELMHLKLPGGIEKIDRIMEGFQVHQVLIAALDLGLFEWLDKEGLSDRNRIAEGIGINGMFSRSFLDCLVDSGFLAKRGEEYFNTKAAVDFLLERSVFFQGDWIRNGAKGRHWKDLVASLKRQESGTDNFNAGPSPSFITSLGQRALRGELQSVAEAVSNWDGFFGSKRLLDLGGGHGLYAVALCQANPHLGGVIFDKPHVIDTTRSFIDKYGLQERLKVLAGDICSDGFGEGYDIIIISHLLYKFRNDLESVFEKVRGCLNPGGLLVTNHWFCAPGCEAGNGGIQDLVRSLQSFGHPLCHVEDFDQLFQKKGFKIVTAMDVSTSYGTSRLHLATKEAGPRGKTVESSSCCCQPPLTQIQTRLEETKP